MTGGGYRTVNMSKRYSVFADVNNKEVDRYWQKHPKKCAQQTGKSLIVWNL